MHILYNIFITLYHLAVYVASFFNTKAKKWIKGRIENAALIKEFSRKFQNERVAWIHCASLGEFEQGRPIIEKLKNENKDIKTVITFFSPSGYEIRKNYPLADLVCYLPLDTSKNAREFVRAIHPSMVIFIKYEFWFNILNELKKHKIPLYLASASFREKQHFFKWYGNWFVKILKLFDHIFVQDEISKNLLERINIRQITVSGDTRFDRVYQTMKAAEEIALIDKFKNRKTLLIAGSTWVEDEKILQQVNKPGLKIILAPHEAGEKNIERVVSLFPRSIRYSQLPVLDDQVIAAGNYLIIDNVGLLARLYRYGDIAYVGGAFGRSLHNILEPAAFGLPVLFGPDFQKNREAAALIEKGGGFSITNASGLKEKLNFLMDEPMILKIASEMSRNFVRSNTGATGKIYEVISKEMG